MKTCISCKEAKPLTAFHKTVGRNGPSRMGLCGACRSAKLRAYRLEDPSKERAIRLASKNKCLYGLTREQINAMYDAQGGVCKICGKPDTTQKKRLHIDHCHTTGVVRGLLCQPCNLMLGQAKDNVETLARAIAYLNGSREDT